MKFLRTLAFATVLAPGLAYAAPQNFKELAEMIVGFMNGAVGVLIVLGLVLYFWGMTKNILKFEEDPAKRKSFFVWGLVVLFVMVSIWGIVLLIQNTLFGGSSGAYGQTGFGAPDGFGPK